MKTGAESITSGEIQVAEWRRAHSRPRVSQCFPEVWGGYLPCHAEYARSLKAGSVTGQVFHYQMDFLLYRIGHEYCDDKLVEFVCENGHRFFHFGARLKLCRECRSTLTPVKRLLPCQVHSQQLPRNEERVLRLDESNLLRTFDGVCIFESACRPKAEDFKKLSPPKAISIIGRTGWTDSYAYKDEGGGGMMG